MEGATEKKLKTVRDSYIGIDLSIHAKREPQNLVRHTL